MRPLIASFLLCHASLGLSQVTLTPQISRSSQHLDLQIKDQIYAEGLSAGRISKSSQSQTAAAYGVEVANHFEMISVIGGINYAAYDGSDYVTTTLGLDAGVRKSIHWVYGQLGLGINDVQIELADDATVGRQNPHGQVATFNMGLGLMVPLSSALNLDVFARVNQSLGKHTGFGNKRTVKNDAGFQTVEVTALSRSLIGLGLGAAFD